MNGKQITQQGKDVDGFRRVLTTTCLHCTNSRLVPGGLWQCIEKGIIFGSQEEEVATMCWMAEFTCNDFDPPAFDIALTEAKEVGELTRVN